MKREEFEKARGGDDGTDPGQAFRIRLRGSCCWWAASKPRSSVRLWATASWVCSSRRCRSRGTPEGPSERLPSRTRGREPSRLDGDSVPVRAACL